MSIKTSKAVRVSLSRALFCVLILLPMSAAMAASKSVPKPNPFLQNAAQPSPAGSYTTQNSVAAQGVAAVAVQNAGDATSASTSNISSSASANNATPGRRTPQQAGSGGGL